MNGTYHIAAPTYQEYEAKLQALIDAEDPALCCAQAAWLPCGTNGEEVPEKINVGKLLDDIEVYYTSGNADANDIANRVVALEIYHAYKNLKVFKEEIVDIPDTPEEIIKLLNTKPYRLCKYIEGLGMDIFDMEREEASKIDTFGVAYQLMTMNDEDFAETFAYAMKLRDKGVNGPDSPEVGLFELKKEDFEEISPFMDWLKDCAIEISTSEETNQSAWWKQKD